MAKAEWGTKRICPNCGTRYYDMRKEPPACPSCGTVFDPEALLRSRRARPIPVEEVKKPPVEADEDETLGIDSEEGPARNDEDTETTDDVDVADIEEDDLDEEVGSEEDEDVLPEDADELGDEDDLGEVVDVEGDEDR
ncbi:TIGR02300 family protein [Rhodospirillum centenum]|uniref:TIGR02300 family protein n=1 Tax=Rhodospirillum centenum (strain ATCC 51521 / SW) TaxID=414684 RepID=B6IUQ1_RHOCS|nr:TIGR02300 family protein [Rhodospirillum centenum]ACI99876.1 conserved hypothetical protein [Rhodospirillum centenum SW]